MIRNSRRPFDVLVLLAAMTAMVIGSREARAIYGMDMGMGFFGGFNPAPSPTQFINLHALIRAGQASTAPGPLRINNHPDSAANRARNGGFSSHYGLESRRSPAFEVDRRVERAREARNNSTQPAAPSAAAAASPPGRFSRSGAFSMRRGNSSGRVTPQSRTTCKRKETSRIRLAWSSRIKSRSTGQPRSRS